MPNKKKVENLATQTEITQMLGDGKSRMSIIKYLKEQGINEGQANYLYYAALKELSPETNLLDDYKRGIIQQNLDRLEKIVEKSMDGNSQEKSVAVKAIAEINKMLGAYQDSSVTIARNKEGDEVIQITFDR